MCFSVPASFRGLEQPQIKKMNFWVGYFALFRRLQLFNFRLFKVSKGGLKTNPSFLGHLLVIKGTFEKTKF